MSIDDYRIRISPNLGRGWPGSTTRITVADEIQLHGGDRVAILGPSGSGKTTLLRILGALDRPSEGKVAYRFPEQEQTVIWGKNNHRFFNPSVGSLRNRFGFVFQDARLIPYLPILENILSAPLSHGVTHRELRDRKKRALKLVKEVELDTGDARISRETRQDRNNLTHTVPIVDPSTNEQQFPDRYPNNLSGGERRRIALLRALMADPLILFADEPTSGVDKKTGTVVMKSLMAWARNGKKERLLIFVTHSPREALSYANRWLVFPHEEEEDQHRLEEKARGFVEEQVRQERNLLDLSLRHPGSTS